MGSNGSEHAGHGGRTRRRRAPNRLDVTRRLCLDCVAQTTPLALEQWTSWLLGEIWKRSGLFPEADEDDAMLFAGTPILDSLAELGTPEAKTTLAALGQLDRGLLGHCARRLAAALDFSTPPWLPEVGTARIRRALSDCRPRDGETLLLEADAPPGGPHMLAVFVDARLGSIAKRLDLVRPINPDDSRGSPDGLTLVEVEADLACQRVRTAIDRVSTAWNFEADAKFIYYRALALARVRPASVVIWPGN